jgi:alpha-L-rhamnosidase
VHSQREGARWKINVSIPPNTTAEIHLPTTDKDQVRESGKPLSQIPEVKLKAGERASAVVLEVGSGEYEFQFTTHTNTIHHE